MLDMSLDDFSSKSGGGRSKGRGKGKGKSGPAKKIGVAKAARQGAVPYKPAGGGGGGRIFGLAQGGGGGGGGGGVQQPVSGFGGGALASRLGGKAAGASGGTKVLVANLASDIAQEDVAELFGTVGEVMSASVRRGGFAEVVFAQQSKAIQAVKQFHLRTLDGVPMEVQLAPHSGGQGAHPLNPVSTNPKAALFGSALRGNQHLRADLGRSGGQPIVDHAAQRARCHSVNMATSAAARCAATLTAPAAHPPCQTRKMAAAA